MNRRVFLAGTASAASAVQLPFRPRKRRVFVFEQYMLRNGSQPARIHDFLRRTAVPGMRRAGIGPVLVMESIAAAHMPQIAVITAYDEIEHMWTARPRLSADPEHRKGLEAWENGAEAPFEQLQTTLLEATDYSPGIAATTPRKVPRVFEVRIYHSPTFRQLRALHERFSGPETRIYQRVGIRPILYSSTLIGQDMPSLTYVIPFDDLATRERAWAAFAADPEWAKVRKASIERNGEISNSIGVLLFRATQYSPIQ
jgi:hypothetical protein